MNFKLVKPMPMMAMLKIVMPKMVINVSKSLAKALLSYKRPNDLEIPIPFLRLEYSSPYLETWAKS
jgi:hypothetical protein